MQEFYSDIAEKKKTASGARHKVNGSHSKTCTLPHEKLTKKELEQMSGPCKTYRLKEPMKWEEFTDMPEDLQKLYVERLIRKYGVTNTRLAHMFCISADAVSKRLHSLGIYRHRGRDKMTQDQKNAWEQFEVYGK